MPWGDSSDQDRSRLCLHTRYNYVMLSAMTGKGVIYIGRAEYCLGGIGIAFLEKRRRHRNKTVFSGMHACVFTCVCEH